MSRTIVMTGRRFGRLTVCGRAGSTSDGKAIWMCECSCGRTIPYSGKTLRSGWATSCGCLKRERTISRNWKHGRTSTPEYRSYHHMVNRCYCTTTKEYKHYGGRGIIVCERWLGPDGFANFYRDIGDRPSQRHSLDRIDVNGNYEPGNCRWATRKEQSRNRRPGRTRRSVIYNGKEMCLSELAELTGVKSCTLGLRINRGLSPENAVALGVPKH